MDPRLKSHVAEAVKRLSDYISYESCNDYEMPDTPENRALWDEYQAWNLGIPLDQLTTHRDYHEPSIHRGELLIDDGILIYALKKATGLLDLKD